MLKTTVNKRGFLCFLGAFPGVSIKTISGQIIGWNHQLFSNFYISGTLDTLEQIQGKSQESSPQILYIGYLEGDMQVGITGSCLKGESFRDAAIREIREELGISVSPKYLRECIKKKLRGKDRYSTIFSLCLDSLDNLNSSDNFNNDSIMCPDLQDDKRYKVVVIIYGSPKKIQELMSIAKPLYNNERINYYASVPKEFALAVTAGIANSKRCRKRKHTCSDNSTSSVNDSTSSINDFTD